MMRFIFLLGIALSLKPVSAQSYMDQFTELFNQKDSLGQVQLLEKWTRENSNDPELYIAYFNFYIYQSKKEGITLGTDPKGQEALKVVSEVDAQEQFYIYGNTFYDRTLLDQGFIWIEKGIQQFPSRLDMRFGKTHVYGMVEDYERFTAEIVKTVEYAQVIQNNWTWSNNEKVKDGKGMMLNSLQDYFVQLYETEDDALLKNMKTIAETVLKYYPDHIESLSNLSIVYLLQEEYDKALEPLLKAEKLSPKDGVVLSNIAQAYKKKGDRKNAVKYYELVVKHGDADWKEYAKGEIRKLKK